MSNRKSEPYLRRSIDVSNERVAVRNTIGTDAGSGGTGERSLRTATVIGGGFGGMAAALRLRALGWRVTLIERLPALGGRAQVFERDGFKHDAGPTVLTAPFLFDELFELFGKRREDYITLAPLKPWYRFHFHDETIFDYGGDADEIMAEIRRIEPADVDGYARLLQHSRAVFDIAFSQLAHQPFHALRTMLAQTPLLLKLRADRTVWRLVARNLRHENLRQAFSIQPLLIGGNPFDTTSIYSLIHYLEHRWGVYFAVGGTGAMVAALQRLMKEQGIEVLLDTTVKKLIVKGGRAAGVELDSGQLLRSDIVVSNTDPLHLYREMIDKKHLAAATRVKLRSDMSMGCFCLYFGTRRRYPNVMRHTIWLGQRYRELLKDIFKNKVLARDFSLYIHRPTATDDSFAPPGCDSFFVLCPVPNNEAGIDWAREAPRLQSRIVAALERTLLPGLSETMTADFVMTPDDFETRYLSHCGSGFSVAPHFTQSAWFRFHNKSESLAGLYLVGAGTHPGAGLPGVLCSAKVVENAVKEFDQSHEQVARNADLNAAMR